MDSEPELDAAIASAKRQVAERATMPGLAGTVQAWSEAMEAAELASTELASAELHPQARFPRAVVLTILVTLGVGAPITAIAVSGWDANTGVFGGTGTEIADSSEWIELTADDAPQAIAELYPTYLEIPAGLDRDVVAGVVGEVWARLGQMPADQPGGSTVQEVGIVNTYESVARCAWYREWLVADDEADSDRASFAAGKLGLAAQWPATTATDGGGIVTRLTGIARAAENGDREKVLDGYDLDACRALTGKLDKQ